MKTLESLSRMFLSKPSNKRHLLNNIHYAAKNNICSNTVMHMMEGALAISELNVADIMVPRPHMHVINIASNLKELLPIVINTAHSRFPVIADHNDDIRGILLAKDLLVYANDPEKDFNINDHLRKAIFIPENKKLDALLQEFRNNKNHMAIVVDEYGGVTGLVTIEDVLEQIVGEIEDEYDIATDQLITIYNNNTFTVKPFITLEEFNNHFKTNFTDNEVDTLGGFICRKLGHVPECNESLTIDNLNFKILRSDHKKIQLLQVVMV